MPSRVVSVWKPAFYKFWRLESTWGYLQHSLSTLLTNLRTTYISLFSPLISSYKHYRIPIPVPFLCVYVGIDRIFVIHLPFYIIHTTPSNRITRLQQWQNLFFLVSTHQLNWILVHIKWTAFNLTENSKPPIRLMWGFFSSFFLVFLPCNLVCSYLPKLLLSSKTRLYFYLRREMEKLNSDAK